ncbi:MAG TPA: hypothetical protein VFV70_12480 [Hyphomonadaceae bacterium]|nr:hypothetical protein [Hyphomonadaceae bacterium]
MRVLFDNGTPRGVAAALSGHIVEEARSRDWDTLGNGELLDAAEAAGFDVFVTTDRNIRYQQDLTGAKRWRTVKRLRRRGLSAWGGPCQQRPDYGGRSIGCCGARRQSLKDTTDLAPTPDEALNRRA